MKITYLVHSTTTDNESGIATGWLPGELSDKGIVQAELLAPDLRARGFSAVFSSDLQRARQTTELFFGDTLPVFLDWRLRECNYGRFDGRPAETFKKNREQDFIETPYPGGESYLDVERRIRSFLHDEQNLFDGKHIAIVSHQAPQLALDVILRGMTWNEAIDSDWRKRGDWQAGWEY